MKKKWLSAAAAAVLSVCALVAPISVPNTVTPVAVQAASSGTTLADMPSAYQSAAEWILQNRIISEGSVKDWATIYDQIVCRKRNTQVCCKMAEQTDNHTGAAEAAANRSGNGSERLD